MNCLHSAHFADEVVGDFYAILSISFYRSYYLLVLRGVGVGGAPEPVLLVLGAVDPSISGRVLTPHTCMSKTGQTKKTISNSAQKRRPTESYIVKKVTFCYKI